MLWVKHCGQEFPVKGLPIPRVAMWLPEGFLRFASQAFLVQSMGRLPPGVDMADRELVLGCSAARDGPFAPAFDYHVQIVRVTSFTD